MGIDTEIIWKILAISSKSDTIMELKKARIEVVKVVAKKLGNAPAESLHGHGENARASDWIKKNAKQFAEDFTRVIAY